jgi:hypothetical protein
VDRESVEICLTKYKSKAAIEKKEVKEVEEKVKSAGQKTLYSSESTSTLENWLKEKHPFSLDSLLQISESLAQLHRQGVVCNLQLDKITCTTHSSDQPCFKVSGAGLPHTDPFYKTPEGTPSQKGDIFSLALIFMKILGLSNRVKNHETNASIPLAQLPQDAMDEYFASCQDYLSRRGRNSFFPLLMSMLHLNPDSRLQSVDEVIEALKSMMIKPTTPSSHDQPMQFIDPLLLKPIIENRKPLAELINDFGKKDPHVMGIEKLLEENPQWGYYPVPKDGHCAFLAVAGGVLNSMFSHENIKRYHLEHLTEALKVIKEHHLQKISTPETPQDLKSLLADSLNNLEDLSASTKTVIEKYRENGWLKLMQEPEITRLWVSFLRHLAAGYILAKRLDEEDNYSSPIYFDRMVNTTQWGGDHELRALADAFGLRIGVLHLKNIGEKGEKYNRDYIYGPEESPKTIQLLFQESNGKCAHYDLCLD